MKKILTTLTVAGLIICDSFFFTGCSHKKQPTLDAPLADAKTTGKIPSKEEMMSKWLEFSTPGPEHKELNRFVGKWDYKVSWWMDPAAPPEVSKGKSEYKWVMGGRYLEQNIKGKSMGQPFEGKGIIAYDKATNKYRSIWYDNMGTGLMIASGLFDNASGTLTEAGSASCPIKGTMPYRYITTFNDKNHFNAEMYMENPQTGYEMKSMLIEYVRVK